MKGTYSSYDPVTGKGTIDIHDIHDIRYIDYIRYTDDTDDTDDSYKDIGAGTNELDSFTRVQDLVSSKAINWGSTDVSRQFHFTVPLDFAKVVNISPGMPVEFDMSPINPYEATNLRY